MSRERKELGNKLATYADTITAFAFVQSVTFSFALGSNDTFVTNAVRVWWVVPLGVIVANLFYAYLIGKCHRGEDALLEPLASPGDYWEKNVRRWRMYVIGFSLAVSLLAYGASWYGSKHKTVGQRQHMGSPISTAVFLGGTARVEFESAGLQVLAAG